MARIFDATEIFHCRQRAQARTNDDNSKRLERSAMSAALRPEAPAADIGTRLRLVRQIYGLTQRELARRAGVTNGAISLIEQNRVSPSISRSQPIVGMP